MSTTSLATSDEGEARKLWSRLQGGDGTRGGRWVNATRGQRREQADAQGRRRRVLDVPGPHQEQAHLLRRRRALARERHGEELAAHRAVVLDARAHRCPRLAVVVSGELALLLEVAVERAVDGVADASVEEGLRRRGPGASAARASRRLTGVGPERRTFTTSRWLSPDDLPACSPANSALRSGLMPPTPTYQSAPERSASRPSVSLKTGGRRWVPTCACACGRDGRGAGAAQSGMALVGVRSDGMRAEEEEAGGRGGGGKERRVVEAEEEAAGRRVRRAMEGALGELVSSRGRARETAPGCDKDRGRRAREVVGGWWSRAGPSLRRSGNAKGGDRGARA